MHTHSERKSLEFPAVENYLQQGVTTMVGGNCGSSPYPISDFISKTESIGIGPNLALLIGHNIQGFDLPALEKVFGFKYKGEILDTLLCSRLIWTNRQELDFKVKDLPPKLIGRHSLESLSLIHI